MVNKTSSDLGKRLLISCLIIDSTRRQRRSIWFRSVSIRLCSKPIWNARNAGQDGFWILLQVGDNRRNRPRWRPPSDCVRHPRPGRLPPLAVSACLQDDLVEWDRLNLVRADRVAGELGEMGGGSVAESLVPHVQLEPEKRIAEENVARSMMATGSNWYCAYRLRWPWWLCWTGGRAGDRYWLTFQRRKMPCKMYVLSLCWRNVFFFK